MRRALACGCYVLAVAGILLLVTCGKQYALVLKVRAQPTNDPPSVFDLRIKNIASGEIVLERIGEKVDPNDPNRDISKQGQELTLAVEFANGGNYLVYIWARSGQGIANSQFLLRDFQVDDVVEKDVQLVFLVGDADGDGFPACGTPEINCGPTSCAFLDCDDGDPNVHPFAPEVCENGKDDDCSAGCNPSDPSAGDAECVDNDGDKVPAGEDCDDNDPCRSTKMKEAKDLCGPIDWNSPDFQVCKDKLAAEGKTFTPPFCGDGIDQDCNGKDVDCYTDADCDGHAPPKDCDDNNAKINPQAPEVCDGVDNNCDGKIDEGCMPCDVDGDKHAAVGHVGPNCNYPKDDPDDFDAGVYPGVTADTTDSEGGSVLGALRWFCSYDLEKNQVLRHRDVDHDGDGKAAKDDGCPQESCDVDGDGFQGAQCSPPKSLEDCNDNDEKVFPGAPDKCGNSTAENCVSDGDCSCDGDGDGYCPPADCDDKNASVHPWATEVCNRIDDDCDKLIDEGNPDVQGVPIRTDLKLCTDDNDGKCAPTCSSGPDCHSTGVTLSGICACSPVDTTKIYAHDSGGNRVICTGENLTAPASPRCFDATQPKSLEECDNDDWNCDGKPFVPGESFPEKGMPYGVNVGECTAGTIADCDLNRTVDAKIKDVMAFHAKIFDEHWVPSGAKEPEAERCNGKDDDCDSYDTIQSVTGTDPGWTELNEKDVDGDTFMACGGCQIADLNPNKNLKGCGDCADTANTIFPGAKEWCDNIDNNCVPNDDGSGECPPQTCCSTQKACRDLTSDFQNCGSCGKVCPSNTTDKCVASKCVCGSTGNPCGNSLNCVSGSCQCIANGLCSGCCSGNTCLAGNTTAACGINGANCQQCTTSDPCKNPVCNSQGQCVTSNKPNGTTCPGGKCFGGSCCTGCWDGNSCEPGTTTAKCGTGGDTCSVCGTSNPCQHPDCGSGVCNIVNNSNGSSCPGGLCYNGSCCTGCWDGSTCQPGDAVGACGSGGTSCNGCTTTDPCKNAACISKTCTTVNKTNGTSCSGGVCCNGGCCTGTKCCTSTGACCTGCCDGNTCRTGNTTTYCGTAGEDCDTCNLAGTCEVNTCVAGNCGAQDAPNGTGCGVGHLCCGGTCCTGGCCDGNSCCGGCCSGGTCQPGNTTGACGDNGASCDTCNSAGTCQVNTCTAGSCGTQPAGDGTGCSPPSGGECCGGSCCQTCCNGTCCSSLCCSGSNCCAGCCDGGSGCMPGAGDTACGSGGGLCEDCTLQSETCQSQVCAPP